MSSKPLDTGNVGGNNQVTGKGSIESELDTGKRLKAIREAHGFSQRELAKRAGITNSTISMIEQGQVSPSVQSLARILSAFPMTLAEFFAVMDYATTPIFFSREDLAATQHKSSSGYWIQQLAQSIPGRQLDMKLIQLPGQTGTELQFLPSYDVCGIVLSGIPELMMGGEFIKLQSGDGFYIQRGQFYRVKNPSEMSAQLVVCSVFNPAA